MKSLAAILFLAISSPAWAIYQCKAPNGTTVFQDSPCEGGGGRQVQVRPARGDVDPAVNANGAAEADAGNARMKRMERDSTLMGIDRQIRDLEYQIERHQANMDAELSALREKQRYANNNLAGATWLQSVANEMQSVTEQYRAKIDADRARIADLNARKDKASGGSAASSN